MKTATKVFIAVVIIMVVAGGYLYYKNANKIETVKISSADAENTRLLFAIINDKGISEKNKIKIGVVYSDPAEAERKLVDHAEGVEVSVFNPLSMVMANQAKNISLRAFVGVHNSYHAILVRKNSHFYKLEDLRGAKIAIRPKASAAYSDFSLGMKTAGMDLEKDFKLTFGSIPQNIASIQKGEVDATFLNIFASSRLLATGKYREINDLDKKWAEIMKFPMPFINFAAHKDWIDSNPEAVVRLKAATLEALKYIHENPNIANEYKDLLGLKTDAEINLVKERLNSSYPTEWNPQVGDRVLQKSYELGILKKLPTEQLFIN